MNLCNDLIRHGLEFARAIDNKQYELADTGLYFPRQKALVGGTFISWVNGADMQVDPNVVPAEALNKILKSGVGVNYIAPFLNNVTPAGSLTAATFDATLNEFTAYDETARPAWTLPADPVGGLYSNSASPAVFTSSTGVTNVSVYGAGILSAAPKESTTGNIIAASKFAAARILNAPDKLTIQYDLSAVSA